MRIAVPAGDFDKLERETAALSGGEVNERPQRAVQFAQSRDVALLCGRIAHRAWRNRCLALRPNGSAQPDDEFEHFRDDPVGVLLRRRADGNDLWDDNRGDSRLNGAHRTFRDYRHLIILSGCGTTTLVSSNCANKVS